MATSTRDAVLLITLALVSAAAFGAILAFGAIQAIPGNGLYNSTIPEISKKYPTDITPAPYAFSIWGLIYLFQLAWIGYVFSTMCRTNKKGIIMLNPVVLPKKFYTCWIGSCAATVMWTFYFDAGELMICAALLVVCTLCGFAALAINLFVTLPRERQIAYSDLMCIRILIQNGVNLFFSWTTLASLISIASALTHDPKSPKHFSQEYAGTICLYILMLIVIFWSVIENTFLFRWVKYVYSWYFVLIWGLTGIIVRYPDTQRKNTVVTIVLLCISVVCLATKITVFVLNTPKTVRGSKKYHLILKD